jgi:hypothetical protein
MNWALILAIWGSILSTILAILKILEHKKDRVNIKVTVRGNYKIIPTTRAYGNRPLIMIEAANRGRRPVTLVRAALLLPRKDGYLLCLDSMTATRPVELSEGKSHQYLMFEDVVRNKYGLTPDKYIACVGDATGRCYWSHNILKRVVKVHTTK